MKKAKNKVISKKNSSGGKKPVKAVKKSAEKIILHIVKRKGHAEVYDERKVYGSCYFACRNAHLGEIKSEWIANQVAAFITRWISNKNNVSSDNIFKEVTIVLKKYDEDASFLYETHRDIS